MNVGWMKELTKRWKPRLIFWFAWLLLLFWLWHTTRDMVLIVCGLAVAVLVDEFIKENYIFKPGDLGKLTHETIAATLAFIAAALAFWRKRGKKP